MDGLSFTTFLKLALMPSTQGKVGTLHRMMSSSDGYDFYKRLKLAGREVAFDASKAEEVLAQLATIKK
jgi:predicted DNA-binding transcriptional regulator AlpA